jgi:hypothetical protein
MENHGGTILAGENSDSSNSAPLQSYQHSHLVDQEKFFEGNDEFGI